ncbi:MAG TPA: hypothetical protein VIL17_05185 [Coriobacteriia bacterium]
MKRSMPIMGVIAVLLIVAGVLYLIDFTAYPDLRNTIGFYTLLDLAFIPLNVLIVGLFINRLIASRERAELIHKMNMVIGAFFSEVGSDMIGRLAVFDSDLDRDRPHMLFNAHWTSAEFEEHRRAVCGDRHEMDLGRGDIEGLKAALQRHRSFILGLLQNGNLLEHASFTDALWAVSHLGEELAARGDLSALPAGDRAHIEIDISRAYGSLLGEWLGYVRHLKGSYPHLFSFAVRTNPFDPAAEIEIGG